MNPGASLRATRRIPLHRLGGAIRDELWQCVDGGFEAAVREGLGDAITKAPDPQRAIDAAIRRLDDELQRAKRLYESRGDTGETFLPAG
jgi:hypothetical protein